MPTSHSAPVTRAIRFAGRSFIAALPALAAALLLASVAHAVDLGSLLHGAPAQTPKAAPPAQQASVSRAPGVAADAQVEGFLGALAAALKARDGQPMRALLSERYALPDTPPGQKSADLFVMAVERVASPELMVLQQVSNQDGQRVARVDLRFSNDRVSSKTLRFDAAGKLLSSDLFRIQRQGAAT